MLLEMTHFVKLEKILCILRYTLIFITVFTLEKQMYLNERLFSTLMVLSVSVALWSTIIYIACKKWGNTFKRQYVLGIIEWIMDLFFIDCFAYAVGYYGDGFIYLIMMLMLLISFVRYGVSVTTFVLDLSMIGNAYFTYSIIYRHVYTFKDQNIIIAMISMILIMGICFYLGNIYNKLSQKLNRVEVENGALRQNLQQINHFYSLVTHIYQSTTIEVIITRVLKSLYEMVKEPNIVIILYDEDGIESNAKIYNYSDKEKGKSIYVQKEIESIREHKAYKNCILNYEPIILENMPQALKLIRSLFTVQEEKYIYFFNLMKNNKECGLIIINVSKRLDTLCYKYIEEIVCHTGYVMFRTEIMERERSKVIFDQLTGARTRHYMLEILPSYISATHAKNGQLGILFVDIDRFKHFNDYYGHAVGDLILKKVSQIMHKVLCKDSLITRYGGEEFLVIVPQIQNENIYELGEKLRAAIEVCSLEDITYDASRMTVSVGIALYPQDGETIDEVIQHADEAMYQVKQTTRNNVCLYQDMKEEGNER